jgi:thermostable 8-oxoguanine DNA glycosylase
MKQKFIQVLHSDVSKAIHKEYVFALLTACFEAISPIDFDFATQTLAIY